MLKIYSLSLSTSLNSFLPSRSNPNSTFYIKLFLIPPMVNTFPSPYLTLRHSYPFSSMCFACHRRKCPWGWGRQRILAFSHMRPRKGQLPSALSREMKVVEISRQEESKCYCKQVTFLEKMESPSIAEQKRYEAAGVWATTRDRHCCFHPPQREEQPGHRKRGGG